MDSWERFNETSLPDKKAFYSELNLEDITEKDYGHEQKVCEELKLKQLGDYHNLSAQKDTLLLADIFENFRHKCIKTYELEPAHFLSAFGLAWQACSKKTELELELLTKNDMLLMVEKGTRGGICQAIHRYAKENNKCMKNYANNLYGWAMSQKLPVNGFEWVEDLSQFKEDFIKNYNEGSNKGYFLEVHVEYLKKSFNLHSDLPFLSERNKVRKFNKLLFNVNDKKNYVVHIKALKQALNYGLIPKKVDRLFQFNQKAWLKPYINMNTKLRTEAKNDFEKDFFKLINKAVSEKQWRM